MQHLHPDGRPMVAPFSLRNGVLIDLAEPSFHDMGVADLIRSIACGLTLTNRYCGQTDHPYPVVQHCLVGARLMETPRLTLLFLLHDAPEGLGLGDVVGPLKKLLPGYSELEGKMEAAIHAHLEVPLPTPEEREMVKHVDLLMLHAEQALLRRRPGYEVDPRLYPVDFYERSRQSLAGQYEGWLLDLVVSQ